MKTFCRISIPLPVSLLLLMIGASCVLTGVFASGPVGSSDAAVAYQVNPTHNAVNNTLGLKPPLKVKWSVDLGGTASYALIIKNGVFVIGGSTSTLYALNAQTGKPVWSEPVPPGYGPWIGAAYDNGIVFVVPANTPSYNGGAIFAFNAKNGAPVWMASLPNQAFYDSPPTALNGIVYTGGAEDGGTVYAVNEKDGNIIWTANVQNGQDSSPVVTTQGVYVSYVCPQTYDFSPVTGNQLWNFNGPCEGGGGNTAVLFGGNLYVRDALFYPTSGLILDAATGSMVGGFNSAFAPVFEGGGGVYTESGSLTAVNLTTQRNIWSAAPALGDSYGSSPVVANGIVYVGTSEGYLLGYGGKTGNNVVNMNLGYPISANEGGSPQAGLAVAQGLLIVAASNELIALEHQ
jgi:outer membrane protein assembly factor BamB